MVGMGDIGTFKFDLERLRPSQAEDLPKLVVGLGSGSAGALSGSLQGLLKLDKPEYFGIPVDTVVKIAAGYVLSKQTTGYLSDFFVGVMANGIGVEAERRGLTIGKFLGGGSSHSSHGGSPANRARFSVYEAIPV